MDTILYESNKETKALSRECLTQAMKAAIDSQSGYFFLSGYKKKQTLSRLKNELIAALDNNDGLLAFNKLSEFIDSAKQKRFSLFDFFFKKKNQVTASIAAMKTVASIKLFIESPQPNYKEREDTANVLKEPRAFGEVSPKTSPRSLYGAPKQQSAESNLKLDPNLSASIAVSNTAATFKPASPKAHKETKLDKEDTIIHELIKEYVVDPLEQFEQLIASLTSNSTDNSPTNTLSHDQNAKENLKEQQNPVTSERPQISLFGQKVNLPNRTPDQITPFKPMHESQLDPNQFEKKVFDPKEKIKIIRGSSPQRMDNTQISKTKGKITNQLTFILNTRQDYCLNVVNSALSRLKIEYKPTRFTTERVEALKYKITLTPNEASSLFNAIQTANFPNNLLTIDDANVTDRNLVTLRNHFRIELNKLKNFRITLDERFYKEEFKSITDALIAQQIPCVIKNTSVDINTKNFYAVLAILQVKNITHVMMHATGDLNNQQNHAINTTLKDGNQDRNTTIKFLMPNNNIRQQFIDTFTNTFGDSKNTFSTLGEKNTVLPLNEFTLPLSKANDFLTMLEENPELNHGEFFYYTNTNFYHDDSSNYRAFIPQNHPYIKITVPEEKDIFTDFLTANQPRNTRIAPEKDLNNSKDPNSKYKAVYQVTYYVHFDTIERYAEEFYKEVILAGGNFALFKEGNYYDVNPDVHIEEKNSPVFSTENLKEELPPASDFCVQSSELSISQPQESMQSLTTSSNSRGTNNNDNLLTNESTRLVLGEEREIRQKNNWPLTQAEFFEDKIVDVKLPESNAYNNDIITNPVNSLENENQVPLLNQASRNNHLQINKAAVSKNPKATNKITFAFGRTIINDNNQNINPNLKSNKDPFKPKTSP